jgi:DNA helicase-2/ATP-dependent DNA helicase PcrA
MKGLETLNPAQREVVLHRGSPLLVIAGAGSGKTKTLTHRVGYLMQESGLGEEEILCITFTNKAAREIASRVKSFIGKELNWVGTFHSIALRILKEDGERVGIDRGFTIADEKDVNKVIKLLFLREDASLVRSIIHRAKEDLAELSSEEREIFDVYQRTLLENKLLDFGDLMYYLYRLLKEHEDIRRKWKDRFKAVLVDEYQDTNTVQYEIIKLLSGKEVCVVGDPNQCIYEWRYAKPQNILRFIEDFQPRILKLEYNYRSKRQIIEIANAVLRSSKAQWKQLIPTLKATKGDGEKPIVKRFLNEHQEAIWIAEEVKRLTQHYELRDIGVLVRVSFITDVLESTLFKANIPYKLVGTVRFYERAEIKSLVDFLRIVHNPSDEPAFSRLVENFCRGLGSKSLELIKALSDGNLLRAAKLSLNRLPPYKAKILYNLLRLISILYKNRERYADALQEISEKLAYEELIKTKYPKDYGDRLDNLREFLKTLKQFQEEGTELEDLLREISLQSQEEEDSQAIRIMTIHSAKGLEFPVVFLPRLEEDILPYKDTDKDMDELEEERRLFYVAITRAMERLYISYTSNKRDRRPSRFLSDIPKSLLNLEHFRKKKESFSTDFEPKSYRVSLRPKPGVEAGALVNHRIFGVGKVLRVIGEKAEVDFRGKIKSIHTAFLEPIS